MTKASDNPFPSILVEEATEPSAPAAGHQRLYIDSTTHKLKRTDSSGTDVTIETAAGIADQGAFTYLDATEAAAPGTPASGKVRIYSKTDGRIYSKDDAGTEYGPFDAAGSGAGASSFLQDAIAGGDSASSRVCTLLITPPEDSHIVVVTSAEGAVNVSSVACTNVTFSKLAESTASTAPHCEIWLGEVGASAGTTVTVTFSSGTYVNAYALNFLHLTGTLEDSAVITNAGAQDIAEVTPDSDTQLVITGGAQSTYNSDFSRFTGTTLWHPLTAFGGTVANKNIALAFGYPGNVTVEGTFPNTHGGTFSSVTVVLS